jgi:hypothetical protein
LDRVSVCPFDSARRACLRAKPGWCGLILTAYPHPLIPRAQCPHAARHLIGPASGLVALIGERTLSMDQFGETRQGACRLASTLAAELAGTLPLWREQVESHAEQVAHTLRASTSADMVPMTTPHHANLIVTIDKRTPDRKRHRAPAQATISRMCEHCGAPTKGRRRYCGACGQARSAVERDVAERRAARLLNDLRTRQAETGKPISDRGVQVAAQHRRAREWTGQRRPPWEFSPVRDALEGVPVAAMAAATELSEVYCQAIRAGRATPHPRHWEALRELADEAAS